MGIDDEGAYTSIQIKDSGDISVELQYAVKEISEARHGLKVTFLDKIGALNLLGKYFFLFVDRIRVDEMPDLNLVIEEAPEDEA